jgi:ribosome-interacting GTPase 1
MTVTTTDFSNKVFGSLTVLHKSARKDNKYPYWVCQCECGTIKEINAYSFTKELTTSCGCKNERKKKTDLQNSIYKRVYQNYKCKAAIREINFNIEENDFIDILSKNCNYCNLVPSNKMSIKRRDYVGTYSGVDRLDITKGYEKLNCVPCCAQCNYAKLSMNEQDFYAWIKRIYEFQQSKTNNL